MTGEQFFKLVRIANIGDDQRFALKSRAMMGNQVTGSKLKKMALI